MATCRFNRLKSVILPLFILMVSGTPAIGSDRNEPIRPLPLTIDLNPDKVALGDLLFHDTRLSGNNTISCAHCHNLATGGSDHRATSSGINGQLGRIKAPTVFNSGFHFVQFWDGRAATLEEQIEGPVHNPLEMGSSWPNVIKKLQADPKLSRTFKKSYPDGITSANIKDAIATFERSLITFNSRFDQWLRGDEKALNEHELQGYLLFKDYGCISCHQGMNVGGNMYGYMGAMGDYFADRGTPLTQADMGRFNITGLEEDKHLFRVPCLRLTAINPPYFHDGSAKTLEEAVRIMGLYQLGREIPPKDVQAIVAFLHTLVGNHPRLHP